MAQIVKTLRFKLVTTDLSVVTAKLGGKVYGLAMDSNRLHPGLWKHLRHPSSTSREASLMASGQTREVEKIKQKSGYLDFYMESLPQLSGMAIGSGADSFKVATISYDRNRCTASDFIRGINWLLKALADERISRSMGHPKLYEIRGDFELVKISDDEIAYKPDSKIDEDTLEEVEEVV
jgi:hypothetical protein